MFIYFNGLLLGLSLIMALGPQNVFLIKQGARRNHAALSAMVCFICDIILACASVAGLHQILLVHPTLQIWLVWFGTAFLLYYAIKAFRSAFTHHKKQSDKTPQPHNRIQIVLFALGFSLLNPHAIIDTLVIIGSGSSQFPDHKMAFLLGVITSSLLWFSSLTMTTRYFSNILTKTTVWQGIELFSGVLMTFIGIKLALSSF
ncbi:LysE/ArgO family amino acid transporter [Legionella quateirensis]|uniref:LysE family transporter n=1 Tax=Legionella quateirensis TaxID=45072 RepID=A0A378L5P0_9GAMM|nr:LysE/ArgO family amino acid transporter [Legionella quateirensis]KTD49314.1 LysE family transporter [Legionella quateirensis]STY19410.1 LysE family transporter [Legionella quateirensis]